MSMNEVHGWGSDVVIQMMNIVTRMHEAEASGQWGQYYKLKNEATLTRITSTKEMLQLRSSSEFSVFNHEKVKTVFAKLEPIMKCAEERKLLQDAQFRCSQLQNKIDRDFVTVDTLLEGMASDVNEIMEFKKAHTVPLSNNVTLYELSDATSCHNPECNNLQFTKTLQKCARCKQVLYCNEECQRKDWNAHRPHCRKIT